MGLRARFTEDMKAAMKAKDGPPPLDHPAHAGRGSEAGHREQSSDISDDEVLTVLGAHDQAARGIGRDL